MGASGAAAKPWKSVVTGVSPYIPCMLAVKVRLLHLELGKMEIPTPKFA